MVKLMVRLDKDVSDVVMRSAITNERSVTREANRLLRERIAFFTKKPARQKGKEILPRPSNFGKKPTVY